PAAYKLLKTGEPPLAVGSRGSRERDGCFLAALSGWGRCDADHGRDFSISPWIRKRFPEELLIPLSLPQRSPGRRPLFAGVKRPKSSLPGIGDHTCSNKLVPDDQDDQGADDG